MPQTGSRRGSAAVASVSWARYLPGSAANLSRFSSLLKYQMAPFRKWLKRASPCAGVPSQVGDGIKTSDGHRQLVSGRGGLEGHGTTRARTKGAKGILNTVFLRLNAGSAIGQAIGKCPTPGRRSSNKCTDNLNMTLPPLNSLK